MSDNVRVTGPIDVVSHSAERVAYELMNTIAHAEAEAGLAADRGKREYWLNLYRQCLKATTNQTLATILNETK